MTTPEGSRGPSPLRVGGLALIGVGAIAGVIGLATLLPGGGGGSSAAPTTTEAAPAPTSAVTVAPTPSGAVPVPAFPTSSATAVPVPPPAAGGAGVPAGTGGGSGGGGGGGGTGAGSGGGGAVTAKSPVRVYNNSTITGLAARAADDFRADGWKVDAVANYPEGRIPTSTVYYRAGTAEQSAASSLAQQFGLRSEPRFAGLTDASPGLIVIVTNDYQKR